jgi:2-polyprenyl-3-methyl-5-hydroxy-6-metoxy-1,4-benzoquinol methylase
MKCLICNYESIIFSEANYPHHNSIMKVPIYFCRNCNTFFKDVDRDSIQKYAEHPMWTNPANYDLTLKSRIGFFIHLYKLVKKNKNTISNWVDFGSSYGHFMEFLKKKKIYILGIDTSNDAIDFANAKGLIVLKHIRDLPKNRMFDVFSLIDSIYYLEQPIETFKQINSRLSANGLIILRVPNRNWRVKFNKYVFCKKTDEVLIDHLIGYSKKSLLTLLKETGFRIIKITSIQKGETRSPKTKYLWYSYYYLSLFLNFISIGLLNLSPGIIIIAKKN